MSEPEVLTPEPADADPEQARPEPSQEVARLDKDGDVFRAMDALDEGQVLDALQGLPSKVLVYKFPAGGKLQTGLSWQGVAEVVRTLNAAGHTQIRVSPDFSPVCEEIQDKNEKGALISYFRITVYAEDRLSGGGNYGTATQPKFQTFTDVERDPELDKFAYAKALSKAQRNAMEPLTPVKFREVLISQMLGDETRVKLIKAGAGAGQEALLPPPLTDERAEELKRDIFGAYDEIKQMNRLALLPGKFHQKLSRATHDHNELAAFLDYLVGMRDHLKEQG